MEEEQTKQATHPEQVELLQEKKRWLFFGAPLTFTTYTLTNRKLTFTEGVLLSKEKELFLYKITRVTYTQSLIQKMFGLGTVILETKDNAMPLVILKNIKNAKEFKEMLSDEVENEKLRLDIYKHEFTGDYSTAKGVPEDMPFAVEETLFPDADYRDNF